MKPLEVIDFEQGFAESPEKNPRAGAQEAAGARGATEGGGVPPSRAGDDAPEAPAGREGARCCELVGGRYIFC